MQQLKQNAQVLINSSTAIMAGLSKKDRIAPVEKYKPDLASLNCNTMNFARPNYETGEILLEFIFENTFDIMTTFAKAMKKVGTRPELEVYDVGHIRIYYF